MRQAAGQVARQAHVVAQLLVALLLGALLVLAALGWRLSQGPIELPVLAHAIEAQASAADGATRLEVGRATVAWEGWRGSGLTPLELRVSAVRLLGRDGEQRAALPDATVSLSLPWLLRGEIAPRRLELRRPELRLRRDANGEVSVALGVEGDDAPAGAEGLLAAMMRPPSDDTPLGALALLAVTGAHVTVEDAQLGITWSLEDAAIELRRLPAGGVAGRGTAMLRMGAARIPVAGSAEARGAPAEIALRLSLPELQPAALAALARPLERLSALDAPARLDLSLRLGTDGVLRAAGATVTAGAGALDLGGGRRVPIAALEAAADWTPDALRLTRAALRLEGPGRPLLTAAGEARREGGLWRARGSLMLDALEVAELRRWWPEGLGGNERAWMLQNISGGVARNGSWRAEAQAAEDLSALRVTALAGTLEITEGVVHWLRPIPPVEGVQGLVTFGLDEVSVQVTAARQSGTQLLSRDAQLRFLFAPDGSVATEMQIGLAGPVPDAVKVLQYERLRLLDRRPLPLRNPQGRLDGRLTLGFPLIETLEIEQMRIRAEARLLDVTAGDVVLGRAIERGNFNLTVDTAGLRLTGRATLAEIQATVAVEMDFRSGLPAQVISRETVTARADARQLAALGLASEEVVQGPVGLQVRSERRRNGQSRVTVRADLRDATLALEPLAWSKPAGQNAGAEAVLRLAGDNLEAIENFRVEAPALLLRGNAAFGRGTRLERVTINEGRVEESRFGGEARPPAQPGGPWFVTMRGQALDLRAMMAAEASTGPPPADPGPAVALDGRFERVLLGPGRMLSGVEARVLVDGRGVVREGRVAGRTDARATFAATITPQGRGRALRVTAEDAGALLRAFGVLQHLQGGQLSVAAAYAHNGPGAPLSGTAEMNEFRVQNAPSFAKLLQAMTLYGMLDAMSGPGLGFARLVAPFTLTPETLTLDEARAFSASLGLTAKGTLDRRRQRLSMEGTIVPAYLINTVLGHLPLIGRLFSPETGGGVFAATWRMQGPLDDPQVSVNPLAALTPGFLRGLFGIGQAQPETAP